MSADSKWNAFTPNMLFLPGIGAFVIALIEVVLGDRPVRAIGYASVWIWLGLVCAFARGIFIAQAKRIRALEERLSQQQRP